MTWLRSAVRPSAAATAVMPSSSGIPAAASAPKAKTRITSVTGSELTSARWKSCWKRCVMALLELASPNSPTNSPGWAAWTASAAASAGATRSVAVSGSPVIWNVTSAAVPSVERCPSLPGCSGDAMRATAGMRDSRATTSWTAARYSAPCSGPLRLWISTCSAARSVGNSRPSTWLAANDSPLPQSACLSVTVPAAEPSA